MRHEGEKKRRFLTILVSNPRRVEAGRVREHLSLPLYDKGHPGGCPLSSVALLRCFRLRDLVLHRESFAHAAVDVGQREHEADELLIRLVSHRAKYARGAGLPVAVGPLSLGEPDRGLTCNVDPHAQVRQANLECGIRGHPFHLADRQVRVEEAQEHASTIVHRDLTTGRGVLEGDLRHDCISDTNVSLLVLTRMVSSQKRSENTLPEGGLSQLAERIGGALAPPSSSRGCQPQRTKGHGMFPSCFGTLRGEIPHERPKRDYHHPDEDADSECPRHERFLRE